MYCARCFLCATWAPSVLCLQRKHYDCCHATFVQELLARAPDDAWPTARTRESTNLDACDTDKNQQIWHVKLVLATTGLHLAQFRQPYRALAKAVDHADLFIQNEAQQEAALSDLAILGALPRKCLVLRLGDSKQTSEALAPVILHVGFD